jgi:predicted  nucleic acid-binding Zn-ribbon protein
LNEQEYNDLTNEIKTLKKTIAKNETELNDTTPKLNVVLEKNKPLNDALYHIEELLDKIEYGENKTIKKLNQDTYNTIYIIFFKYIDSFYLSCSLSIFFYLF